MRACSKTYTSTHPHTRTHTDTPTPIWYLWWWHQSKGNANFRLEPQTIRPKADLDILIGVAKVCESLCVCVCLCQSLCMGGHVWVWTPVKPLSCVCLKCSLHSMCGNFIWALAHPSLFIYDSLQQQLARLTPNRTDSNKNRPQNAQGKTTTSSRGRKSTQRTLKYHFVVIYDARRWKAKCQKIKSR